MLVGEKEGGNTSQMEMEVAPLEAEAQIRNRCWWWGFP